MKRLLMLTLCVVIVSCEKIHLNDISLTEGKVENPQTDLIEDLKFVINGEFVGQGYNSSSVNRNFISCAPTSAFVNNSFANILKSFKVAYGGLPSAFTCGSCTGFRFSCSPGDNVTISGNYYGSSNAPAGSFTEPADYESHNQTANSSSTINLICPTEGYVEQTNSSSATYIKITVSSNGNSDTEYLECQ